MQSKRLVHIAFCIFAAMACLVYIRVCSDLPDWWRRHGGGIPYVVFWIAFVSVFWPQRRLALPISVLATSMTCLLEFAQLWKPAWLMAIRATRLGAALLGSGFTWADFPPYLIGGLLGYGILLLASPPAGPQGDDSKTNVEF